MNVDYDSFQSSMHLDCGRVTGGSIIRENAEVILIFLFYNHRICKHVMVWFSQVKKPLLPAQVPASFVNTNLPAYENTSGQDTDPARSRENSQHSQTPAEHLETGHSGAPLPVPPTNEELNRIELLGVNYIENPNFK